MHVLKAWTFKDRELERNVEFYMEPISLVTLLFVSPVI